MRERQAGPIAHVLGSAAGGGFPQWNCGCRLCTLARSGDSRVRPATQVSIAVSANGGDEWSVIGASPDLRQQINATPALWPRATRHSPIASVVLTNADVDAIAGLLVLRERQPFAILAPHSVLGVLEANRIFAVLDPGLVQRVALHPLEPHICAPGLEVTLLPLPGKVPLYLEDRAAAHAEPAPAFAARLRAGGRTIIVAPACADLTDEALDHLRQADVLFFDGTVFTDDEMAQAGAGGKTGRRMGHVPISGEDGSLARLSGLSARKIYFHINNTNPILLAGSPERRQVEAAGFEVAYDGMEVRL